VTVTGAEVSPDLRHARVYVSVLGSETEKQATFDGLDSVASFLRSRVARQLQLRVAPEIQFKEDDTIARAAEALRPIAQERGVAFILNDRPDIAANITEIRRQEMERAREVLGVRQVRGRCV